MKKYVKNFRKILIAVAAGLFLISAWVRTVDAPQTAAPAQVTQTAPAAPPVVPEIAAPSEPMTEPMSAIEESEETEETEEVVEEVEEVSSSAEAERSFSLICPVAGEVVTPFSDSLSYSVTMGDWRMHYGIDIASETGEDVLCAADGEVEKVYFDLDWGNCVEIIHDGGRKTIYRNLGEDIPVTVGGAVSQGQAIGTVGESGELESGLSPHLHFEYWEGEKCCDPTELFI